MEEIISQNAGKVLLKIYLTWKTECSMPAANILLEVTKLSEDELERALKYCQEKNFLDVRISKNNGLFVSRIKESEIDIINRRLFIKGITAAGIDVIEKPQDEKGEKPFNLTFNLNNEFNIESIIKGEAKLF